jgi:hypothetical protein
MQKYQLSRMTGAEPFDLTNPTANSSREVGYWMPRGISPESYLTVIKSHEPVREMLDYLSKNHRAWADTDFNYNESENGVCEKCSARELKLGSMGDMKYSGNTGFDGEGVRYSKFIAERFSDGKEPITLTPELHREFICQSWVEGGHLDHIPEERMCDPGIAAIEAQPDLSDDKPGLLISFRVIDGSHRAALTHREGRPFSAYILTPVENLKSIFAIGTKKNPFFALRYSPELEEVLRLIARDIKF